MTPLLYTEKFLPRTTMMRVAAALSLIAITLFGDRVLARGLDHILLQSGLRFSRIYQARDPHADVLILGNSRSVASFFAPGLSEVSGESVLNLSYNGMSPLVIEAIFLDWLDRHTPPRLIVIEPTCVFARPEAADQLRCYNAKSARLAALAATASPLDAATARVSHLYNFNNEVFHRAIFYLGSSDQAWANQYTIGEAQMAELRRQPAEYEMPEISSENLDALIRTQDAAHAAGVEVRWVVGPYLPIYRASLEWWPSFVKRIEELAATPVLDLSMAVAETSAFADKLHLNYSGLPLMLKRLQAGGLFAPR